MRLWTMWLMMCRPFSNIWAFERAFAQAVMCTKGGAYGAENIGLDRLYDIGRSHRLPYEWITYMATLYQANFGFGGQADLKSHQENLLLKNPPETSVLGIHLLITTHLGGSTEDAEILERVYRLTERVKNPYERWLLRAYVDLLMAEDLMQSASDITARNFDQIRMLAWLGDMLAPLFTLHLLDRSVGQGMVMRSILAADASRFRRTAFHPEILNELRKEIEKN